MEKYDLEIKSFRSTDGQITIFHFEGKISGESCNSLSYVFIYIGLYV